MSEGTNPTKEARQGSCAYKDYFFQFHNANCMVEIYNLKTKRHLQTIEQTPISAQHCNTVMFSKEKWDKRDRFPVIYVSTERDGKILVYRVLGEDGNMSFQTVQTIFLPACEDMGLYYPNPAIDSKHQKLWLTGFSCNTWKKAVPGNVVRYIQLPLPPLKGGDATLNLGQKLREFTLPFTYATQGLIYHKDKIIQSYGTDRNTNRVRIINPQSGKIEREYLPHKYGLDDEPEGTFMYKGRIMFSTVQGNLYFADQFKLISMGSPSSVYSEPAGLSDQWNGLSFQLFV